MLNRLFSKRSMSMIGAKALADKAAKSAAMRLAELNKKTEELGHEKALEYMQTKYPGSFIAATAEDIEKNHQTLTEASNENPFGYY